MPRQFYNDGIECHLCHHPIPDWIASPTHPLFGTIDHVTPRAKGGPDRADNRAPAHRCCNILRGTHDITPEIKDRCRALAVAHLTRLQGVPHLSKRWKAVRALQRRAPERPAPERPALAHSQAT